MTQPTQRPCDITILGGGMVGLVAALSLQPFTTAIRIVEKHLPNLSTNPLSNRPISLTHGTCDCLEEWGLWDDLKTFASPILSVHVSEQKKFGIMRFTAEELDLPALGYVVPYGKLIERLYHHVELNKNIEIQTDAITRIEQDKNGIMLFSENHCYQSPLTLFADGAESAAAKSLGISYETDHEGDIAMVFHLQLEKPHRFIAYQRFTAHGIFAILPLPEETRAQCVWTVKNKKAREISHYDASTVLSLFQSVFENRLAIAAAQKITEMPLIKKIAHRQIVAGGILIGNSAHTLPPVAAQGFNLAVRDLQVLRDLFSETKKNKKPHGDPSILNTYEERVLSHQKKIYAVMDKLIGVFDLPLLGGFRGLGLMAADVCSVLNKALAKRMMSN